MTAGKFLIFTAIAVALTTAVKLFFIAWLNIENIYLVYLMWFLVAVISIACCRRLGVISYLEAFFVLIVWLVAQAFFDLLIISTVVGPSVYGHLHLWISYLVMMVMVFLFHKERHVAVRKLQRARSGPEPPKLH